MEVVPIELRPFIFQSNLKIQMHDALFVHVVDSFAYLSGEQNAVFFGEREIVSHHSFEQFTAGYAENINDSALQLKI